MITTVPFSRIVRTELRKLTDTRAGRWLLIAVFAATPIVVAVMLATVNRDDLTYDTFVNYAQTPQKVLLPVLGVLTITSEWSQRTGLVTFALVPHRGRVLLAKATATLLLGVLTIAFTFATAAAGTALTPALRGGTADWTYGLGGFRDLTVVLLTGLAQGLAFGMLLLASAAAVVTFYLIPNLSGILFGSVASLRGIGRWVDLNQAQGALYTHHLTGRQWAQVLTATLLWVAVPAAAGTVRVLKTEIKSQ